MGRHFRILFFVLLAGCSTAGRPLMPTPNVYAGAGAELFVELPDAFESTEVERDEDNGPATGAAAAAALLAQEELEAAADTQA